MRWLAIIGLSLDGVGAMLISWPLLVSRPEDREESIGMRFGGNPWGATTRSREARFVQVGALFLVLGFLLQAVAYVRGPDTDLAIAVGVIALTILLGLAAGIRIAGRGLPRYVIAADAAIQDQRHIYNVATVRDYRTLLNAMVQERHGRPPVRSEKRAPASITGGSWRVKCPECDSPVGAWPENPEAICTDEGHLFGVDFPSENERRGVEERLAALPRKERNWAPDPKQ